MKETERIYRGVTESGEFLHIEFLVGPSMRLTRNQAIALLEAIQEQLPNMAFAMD